MATFLGQQVLTPPAGVQVMEPGDALTTTPEAIEFGPYSWFNTVNVVSVEGGPANGTLFFAVATRVNGEDVLSQTKTLVLLEDGSRVGSLNLAGTEATVFLPAGQDIEHFIQLSAIEDESEAPWVGSISLTWTLARDSFLAASGFTPAVDEQLLSDLRALYTELVTDPSVSNDRAVTILEPTTSVGANGERSTTLAPSAVVYGMVKPLSQSAASRALGKPTAERVVEITLPYETEIGDSVFRIGDSDYYPIPGENNLDTSYRVNTRFLAKARS